MESKSNVESAGRLCRFPYHQHYEAKCAKIDWILFIHQSWRADGTVFCARHVHALHVKYTVRIQGSTVSESVGGIGMHKCESLLTVDEFSLLFVMYRPASLADAGSNGFRIEFCIARPEVERQRALRELWEQAVGLL